MGFKYYARKYFQAYTMKLIFALLVAIVPFLSLSQTREKKARVIVMTDGEIDDRSSMVRFLLYNCDIKLLAIIQTNSVLLIQEIPIIPKYFPLPWCMENQEIWDTSMSYSEVKNTDT